MAERRPLTAGLSIVPPGADAEAVRAFVTQERKPELQAEPEVALLPQPERIAETSPSADEPLRKRKGKVEQDLKREQGKLANPNFVANAKPEVVAEVHERIAEFQRQIAQLDEQEQMVGKL